MSGAQDSPGSDGSIKQSHLELGCAADGAGAPRAEGAAGGRPLAQPRDSRRGSAHEGHFCRVWMRRSAVSVRSSTNLWITRSGRSGAQARPDPGLASRHPWPSAFSSQHPRDSMSAAMATCLSAIPATCSSSRATPAATCGASHAVLLPSVRSAFRGSRIAAPSLGCARRQIDATCRAVRPQPRCIVLCAHCARLNACDGSERG